MKLNLDCLHAIKDVIKHENNLSIKTCVNEDFLGRFSEGDSDIDFTTIGKMFLALLEMKEFELFLVKAQVYIFFALQNKGLEFDIETTCSIEHISFFANNNMMYPLFLECYLSNCECNCDAKILNNLRKDPEIREFISKWFYDANHYNFKSGGIVTRSMTFKRQEKLSEREIVINDILKCSENELLYKFVYILYKDTEESYEHENVFFTRMLDLLNIHQFNVYLKICKDYITDNLLQILGHNVTDPLNLKYYKHFNEADILYPLKLSDYSFLDLEYEYVKNSITQQFLDKYFIKE